MEEYRVIEGSRLPLSHLKKLPEHFWYRGDPTLLQRPKVSIVGTRRPMRYTREYIRELADALARRGVAVVSGAAMGVDAMAHTGAGPSNTIAVVANGVDIRYPATNAPLIESIEQDGLVLSQFKPGSRAAAWSFVIRNEIVVALGEVLVIGEADENSGSMRSAEYALKQGKEIYVLPHRLGESAGTNRLLKEGLASPIYSIEAFAERFGVVPSAEQERDEFFYFCQKHPTMDEAVLRFGDRVFEEELEGKIVVENGRIRPA
ncbi:DNA-processing protein DprA [Nitratifractor sp.]|uniref:DNA-processing protein DprA n=1 Tax=Nitratifractor sp. TaxID=2268144 RepID=UPI0025ED48AB|nr:DNA-processing protein DprA [Nitratifractor sp.]